MSVELYGFVAASLTTIAFLPQLIKIIRTKSADDVSILMLSLFIIGVFFWILYGFLVHSLPVLVANVITLTLNCSILVLKIFYSNNQVND